MLKKQPEFKWKSDYDNFSAENPPMVSHLPHKKKKCFVSDRTENYIKYLSEVPSFLRVKAKALTVTEIPHILIICTLQLLWPLYY